MEFGRHPSLDNVPLPAAKRQKITVACDPCRARKVRCDGNRPTCRQCMRGRKKVPCTYDRQLPETQQRYIQELESRHAQSSSVSRMESVIQSVETAPTTERHTDLIRASATSAGPSQPAPASDEPQDVICGESSSTTVLHQSSRLPEQPQRSFVSDAMKKVPMKLGGSMEKAGVLPRRRIADDMIAEYWRFVHPLFPILHKPTFMAAYEKSWTSQSGSDTIADERCREFEEALFLSTLNIMFALGTRFCGSVPATEKSDMSKEFYDRSRQIFTFDVLDCTSIPVLQMVLLQGVYLQSTTEVSRCWNVIGVATRMAQSLGLHLYQTHQRQKTLYAREMGSRLWHSCLILDRLAAATFGWPMMIHGERSVALPILGDDDISPQSFNPTTSMKSSYEVRIFTHTCGLFSIIGDILSTLYCNNGPLILPTANQLENARTLSQIMALNGRLEAYLITIPKHLRTIIEGSVQINSVDTSGPTITIQHAITCRYLYAKILLLRPALLMPLDSPEFREGEMILSDHHKLTMHAIDTCSSSGIRLLEMLHKSLDSPFRIADWHVVYMTFTAVTSMLAIERTLVAQSRVINIDTINAIRWSRQIFRYMEPRLPISTQALQSLEAIICQVANETEMPSLKTAGGSLVPSVEQHTDGSLGDFGELDAFDWLANPSALLSRQTPGLDISWLTGPGDWFS